MESIFLISHAKGKSGAHLVLPGEKFPLRETFFSQAAGTPGGSLNPQVMHMINSTEKPVLHYSLTTYFTYILLLKCNYIYIYMCVCVCVSVCV